MYRLSMILKNSGSNGRWVCFSSAISFHFVEGGFTGITQNNLVLQNKIHSNCGSQIYLFMHLF